MFLVQRTVSENMVCVAAALRLRCVALQLRCFALRLRCGRNAGWVAAELRLYMAVYGCIRLYMAVYGCIWPYMVAYGSIWL